MKVEKNDVIRLNADADVALSYKSGSPPLKVIKNEMWIVDDIEEDPIGEGYILNISTFEPFGNINAGSYCSFVHSDDVKSIEKVYRIKKENIMKKSELVQLIESIVINEIGEATSKSYDIIKHIDFNGILMSQFKTDSGLLYEVNCRIILNALDIDFKIKNNGIDSYPETNRNELFRVMATIFSIVFNYLKEHDDIKYIRYNAKSKDDNTNQRDKLYRRYIQKHIPNATFQQSGGTVFAKIK